VQIQWNNAQEIEKGETSAILQLVNAEEYPGVYYWYLPKI